MTSQVRSKSKCLTILRVWLCRAQEPYEMETSQYNDMDRIWDTSRYHPKLSVSIFKVKVIQGHKVKERSNWKFWVWVAWYMFLGQFFVKNAKNDPRTLFERPKSEKILKIGKMQKSPEIGWKMAVFDLLNAKTRTFFKISTWNFVHVYTWQDSFTYIPVFWKFENFAQTFLKITFFVDYFFTIFKIFKILKIRDSSLLATCILNNLLKTNCFYHLKCLRDSVSREPLFLPKTGKTWRHSDVIYGRRIKASKFSFCQDV